MRSFVQHVLFPDARAREMNWYRRGVESSGMIRVASLNRDHQQELVKMIFGESTFDKDHTWFGLLEGRGRLKSYRHRLIRDFLREGYITLEERTNAYRMKAGPHPYHTDTHKEDDALVAQWTALFNDNEFYSAHLALLTPVIVQQTPRGTYAIHHSAPNTASFSEVRQQVRADLDDKKGEGYSTRWLRGSAWLPLKKNPKTGETQKWPKQASFPAYNPDAPTVRAVDPVVTLGPEEVCVTSVVLPFHELASLGKAWEYDPVEQTATYTPDVAAPDQYQQTHTFPYSVPQDAPVLPPHNYADDLGGRVNAGENESQYREVIAHLISDDTTIGDLDNIKFQWRTNKGQGAAHVPRPPPGWATVPLAWMTQHNGEVKWHRNKPQMQDQIDCVAYHDAGSQWWRLGSGRRDLRSAFVDASPCDMSTNARAKTSTSFQAP